MSNPGGAIRYRCQDVTLVDMPTTGSVFSIQSIGIDVVEVI
ncbi:hypothetical protein OAL01_03630 [Rubripirellula sp.]|nr:hypothetical protein [Rubripirellula sp.]